MSDQRSFSAPVEYLEGSSTAPRAGSPPTRYAGALAVVAVTAAAVGAAVLGTYSFLSGGGDQPAAALPASTLAYASVDLDPSASQKIEAFRTLRKFPSLRRELGIDTGDDLRRIIVEQVQQDGSCPDLDYDHDIAPWLGDRAGFGAVGLDDAVVPVLALQVSDRSGARAGLQRLAACDPHFSGRVPMAFSGSYVLVSDSRADVDRVVRAAAAGSLADDPDYRHWTSEAGTPGIVGFYVSADAPTRLTTLGGQLGAMPGDMRQQLSAVRRQYAHFTGAAGVVRFHDGALEAETAAGGLSRVFDGAPDGTLVRGLPAQTGFAVGFDFRDVWLRRTVHQLAETFSGLSGEPGTPQQMYAEVQRDTGLHLPDDVVTLLGHGTAVAVDGNLDVRALSRSKTMPAVPVGVLVDDDAAGVKRVVGILDHLLAPGPTLSTRVEGDRAAYGLDAAWEQQMLADGGLGSTDSYRSVVPHADDATSVMYLNFDAGDGPGWVASLADSMGGDARQFRANVAPLDAFGASTWRDGDVQHGLFRLTTD